MAPAAFLPHGYNFFQARDDDCDSGKKDEQFCEKPVTSTTKVLPIVLGVVIPIVVALILLYYFHRRGVRRQRLEEAADPNGDLDFGLGNGKGKGGKPAEIVVDEKMMGLDPKHRAQMSMDMNLNSPYLLPPTLQDSKESLHSLARNLNNNEDPYRPVGKYSSDMSRDEKTGSSTYSRSTKRRETGHSSSSRPPPRGNSLPQRQASLPQPPPPVADPFATPTPSETGPISPMPPGPSDGIVPGMGSVAYPEGNYDNMNHDGPMDSYGQQPHAVGDNPDQDAQRQLSWGRPGVPLSNSNNGGLSDPSSPDYAVGLGLDAAPGYMAPEFPNPSTADQPFTRDNPPVPSINPEQANASYDASYDNGYQDYDYNERGRSEQRRSMEGQMQDAQTLGVPQQDNKRLSVGLRPLPPDEVTESEDPEERANRIRSFYKEYFDDSKPAPGDANAGAYYEDYDANYLGADSAFYDPTTNQFVMPYAEPVTRRAMTPPPGAGRRPYPGPPRAMHGSMGGPGGRRPPPGGPRGASAMSHRGPPRPGSSMSSSYGQPRPGSSASNMRNKPRGPPPAALTTLPTPSKLRDDSMALLGSIDFAPPETYEDRTRGRSQSPVGERRPYKPKVPIASPLANSYDELASVPSPHLLRKSGTFTGLDFAPPRKFQTDDNMSDAGSIRSNRSGLSAAQAHAIRGGAGRVSRLPGDIIFSQATQGETLKPQWNMRQM